MTYQRLYRLVRIAVVVVVCLVALRSVTQAVECGGMKADSILFLGNSITLAGPYSGWSDTAYWGMAASAASKDYVHLLTQSINTTTGGSLTVTPPPSSDAWPYGDPLPSYSGNVLNIADIFERNYNTWDNARIQNQLDAKPDIVILQFGENMSGGIPEQFKSAFEDLLNGLKNSSNPNIFVTSFILGSNPTIDAIKQQVCAEDSSHRAFVDLSGFGGYLRRSGTPQRRRHANHCRHIVQFDGCPFSPRAWHANAAGHGFDRPASLPLAEAEVGRYLDNISIHGCWKHARLAERLK